MVPRCQSRAWTPLGYVWWDTIVVLFSSPPKGVQVMMVYSCVFNIWMVRKYTLGFQDFTNYFLITSTPLRVFPADTTIRRWDQEYELQQNKQADDYTVPQLLVHTASRGITWSKSTNWKGRAALIGTAGRWLTFSTHCKEIQLYPQLVQNFGEKGKDVSKKWEEPRKFEGNDPLKI